MCEQFSGVFFVSFHYIFLNVCTHVEVEQISIYFCVKVLLYVVDQFSHPRLKCYLQFGTCYLGKQQCDRICSVENPLVLMMLVTILSPTSTFVVD